MDRSAAGPSQINKSVVPLLQSDSDGEYSDQEQNIPMKKKREYQSWVFVAKFDSASLAHKVLDQENIWSINYSNESKEGKKTYYRCNKVKKRGPQCSARRYILYDSLSDAVFLYRTEDGHDHESKESTDRGLSEVAKLKVNELLDLHLKPKAIMTALSKVEGLKLPKMSQLKNYLNDCRRGLSGNHTISLGELESWLLDNSALPENLHEAFVTAYEISEKEASFRFVLSSKYLLELARHVDILHADATYKLIWQGYPVLIVGTTDKQRKFHALCLAVSTTEQKDDFKLVFKSMNDNIQLLFESVFKPTILVAGAGKIMQKAFNEEFEDTKVRMCWAHAKRNIQSKVESLVDKTTQKQILADIDILHSITNQDDFDKATNFFLQKYDHERNFIAYFKKQWLLQNQNWYLGAAPLSPSTNNALEAFNKVIKDSNTFRERLQLSRFLFLAKEMVNEWSIKYTQEPVEKYVAESPEISLKDWTDSYNWAKLQKEIVITTNDSENFTYYRVPAAEAKECAVFEKPPEKFDEFIEQLFSKWEIILPNNREEWTQGTCTCPTFHKMYMCKHIIGLAIRLKYAVQTKNIPLGQKRKRGRPLKAKPTLILQ
ncbi:hypothetical protein ABMA27_004837 [Loxostege sticticalis]|uniref:SWIM-type domain-containing protein n=1 Tax=Loxostege sticticalis TaxID=481309 RepID=A0ABR3HKS4_LOXSC